MSASPAGRSSPGAGAMLTVVLALLAAAGLVRPAEAVSVPALAWHLAATGQPSPRHDMAMADDPTTGQVLLFSGMGPWDASFHPPADSTWVWSAGQWYRPKGSGPEWHEPVGRSKAAMAFDGDDIILFGGQRVADGDWDTLGDTWIWDSHAQTWSQWTPPPSCASPCQPDHRYGAAMAYDPIHHQAVLYGGFWGQDGCTNRPPNCTSWSSRGFPIMHDTWTFDRAHGWQLVDAGPPSDGNLDAGPGPTPPAVSGYMAFDGVSGLVHFGGYLNGPFEPVSNETWRWDLITHVWTKLAPLTSPPQRWGASIAYDGKLGKAILFGGGNGSSRGDTESTSQCVSVGSQCEWSDTWAWDAATGSWIQLITTPATTPPPRHGAGMAFDGARGTLVLFGGACGHWSVYVAGSPCPLTFNPNEGTSMVYEATLGHQDYVLGDTWVTDLGFQPDRPTVTTVTASPGPTAAVNQPVTLRATVADAVPITAGVPPGYVTFSDGSTPVGARPLDAQGRTSITVALAAGTHTITAAYGGGGHYLPSSGQTREIVFGTGGMPPSLTGMSPTSGPITGGTAVSLTGSGFNSVQDVSFGGMTVANHPCAGVGSGRSPCFTVRSDAQIVVYTPAVATPRTVPVTVASPAGTSGWLNYQYTSGSSPSPLPVVGPAPGAALAVGTVNGAPPTVPPGAGGAPAPAPGAGTAPAPGPAPGQASAPVSAAGVAPVVAPGGLSGTAPTPYGSSVPGFADRVEEGPQTAVQDVHAMVRRQGPAAGLTVVGAGVALLALAGCVVVAGRRAPRTRPARAWAM